MRLLLKCAGGFALALIASLVVPSQGSAQIPNPGFETWNGDFPDGWIVPNVPGFVTSVTASDTRRSGSFSARGEVVLAFDEVWPPYFYSVFPATQVPERFQMYYQFAPQGGDVLLVSVVFYDGFTPVAQADTQIIAPAGAFSLIDLSMEEVLPGTPDSCYIIIAVDAPVVGTTVYVDDLSFSGTSTSVAFGDEMPAVFALDQNYPNPFNPSTTIEYSLPEASQVRLEVYNAIGERVATLVDTPQDAGRYQSSFNAAALPSGVYLYRLSAGGSVSVKRMILMK